MAKLSKVDAAKAAGVSRQTLYTYIKDHRISVDPDGLIDTAELLRAGFTLRTLHETGRPQTAPVGHPLTSRLDTVDTLDVYQDMIAMLKQQLSEAQTREQAAVERERIALPVVERRRPPLPLTSEQVAALAALKPEARLAAYRALQHAQQQRP